MRQVRQRAFHAQMQHEQGWRETAAAELSGDLRAPGVILDQTIGVHDIAIAGDRRGSLRPAALGPDRADPVALGLDCDHRIT